MIGKMIKNENNLNLEELDNICPILVKITKTYLDVEKVIKKLRLHSQKVAAIKNRVFATTNIGSLRKNIILKATML